MSTTAMQPSAHSSVADLTDTLGENTVRQTAGQTDRQLDKQADSQTVKVA